MVKFYCDVLGCRLERGPGEFRLAQLRAGQSGTRYGAAGMGPSLYLRDPEGNTVEFKG